MPAHQPKTICLAVTVTLINLSGVALTLSSSCGVKSRASISGNNPISCPHIWGSDLGGWFRMGLALSWPVVSRSEAGSTVVAEALAAMQNSSVSLRYWRQLESNPHFFWCAFSGWTHAILNVPWCFPSILSGEQVHIDFNEIWTQRLHPPCNWPQDMLLNLESNWWCGQMFEISLHDTNVHLCTMRWWQLRRPARPGLVPVRTKVVWRKGFCLPQPHYVCRYCTTIDPVFRVRGLHCQASPLWDCWNKLDLGGVGMLWSHTTLSVP